jgi:lipoprotein-releasing system permease protein
MHGLSKDMATRIIGAKGEIKVYNKDFSPIIHYDTQINELCEKFKEITNAGPVNKGEYLLKRNHHTMYTENFGIDFKTYEKNSDILKKMRIGTPNDSLFKENGIILGLDLAWNLIATVGDTVELVSPLLMVPTLFGGFLPKIQKFKVVGIFHTGMPEYDGIFSYIDINNSTRFKPNKGIDHIEVNTKIKNNKLKSFTEKIEKEFPNLKAEHWEIFDKSLFQAIKIERIAMNIVMSIILILASFNMTGNFIRTITEKKEEIAILKAIGMNKNDIVLFFIIMGLIIAILAIFIADIMAFLLLFFQSVYQWVKIPVPGFPFSAIPVDLSIIRIILFSLLAIFICLIGTLYPAIKTLKIDIIEVLNEEKNN